MSGDLNIARRDVTVRTGDYSRVYTGSTITVTVSGTAAGLVQGYSIQSTATASGRNVGSYGFGFVGANRVMASGVDVTANYNILPVPGVLTITPAAGGGTPPPPFDDDDDDDGTPPPPVDDDGTPPPPVDDGGTPPPPVDDGGTPPPPVDDGGDDDDDDFIPFFIPDAPVPQAGNLVSIDDAPVPLAGPMTDTITIIDESVPLGLLPVSGATREAAPTANSLLAVDLFLEADPFQKKEEDNEDSED